MFNKFLKKYNSLISEILYILAIIIFTLTMIFSNVYIKFLPMLYFLGIISVCIFKQKTITSFLVGITTMLTIYFFDLAGLKYNLIYTMYFGISTFLGEITGQVFTNLIKIKKVNSKYINNSIFIFFIFVISLLLNNYFNGNIFSYLNYTKNLNKYLKENYANYNILNSRYVLNKYGYLVEIDDEIYKFYISGDNIIRDEYQDKNLKKLMHKLNNKYNLENKNKLLINISNENDKIFLNVVNVDKKINLDEYIKLTFNFFNSILNDLDFDRLNINYITDEKIKFATVNKENFTNFDYYKSAFVDEIIK